MRFRRSSRSGAASRPEPEARPGEFGDDGTVVPVHPEAVIDDPQSLRWVVPPGVLAVRGRVTAAPGALDTLIASGEVEWVEAGADAVTIRLRPDLTWREFGPRVRTALGEALRRPEAWSAESYRVEGPDALLAEAARAAIDGEAGDYVRSHGGHIEFVGAHDGTVDVRLTGACGHCPAAAATLRYRVETGIRAGYPELVDVRQVS